MYYPIIDKLKDVMAEIGQGGGGVLVIEGDFSTKAWTGSFSDIKNSFINGTPVYFKCTGNSEGEGEFHFLMPLAMVVNNAKAMDASGSLTIYANNTFALG